MPSLSDPIKLGGIEAKNRILMAPLTRGRATKNHVPTAMMVEYYRQRATAGLIISEATGISLQGSGWPYAPGIWTQEQVEAWRAIVDAVHSTGGKMISQLWHMGRVNHSNFPGRGQPVSASATTAPGLAHTYEGKVPYEQARPLRIDEIPDIIEDYKRGARNALAAGFDGVQIHGANGYLIDQFLRNGTNLREDEYGGSIENRIRLLEEVTKGVVSEVGAELTSVRLSPNGDRQGVNDSNPQPLFVAATAALDKIGIAFLEIREPDFNGTNGKADHPPIGPHMRKVFSNPFVVNADYDRAKGQAAIDNSEADAISFGRKFITNPDLPRRLLEDIPLNPSDDNTLWYGGGAQGYIDYPFAA
ncbi:alkene reductase [Mesorhizobium sp.]|uniref:alkene reductase n=1 Tax=Mesorhizobium sp. TaxID=1871066 RepID=UPI000FE6BA4D|nr:alkene reductase [Mesorhizobium sp.]RWE79573.1 MAG: alkene reductase [Mesorhizobium sp.]